MTQHMISPRILALGLLATTLAIAPTSVSAEEKAFQTTTRHQARIIHVMLTGHDNGDGSETNPLRTIQAGAKQAQAGDTVFVHEGTYRERVAPPRGGTPDAPIRFVAEPGKNVIIKGSDLWQPQWEREGVLFHALPDEALFNDDCYVDDRSPFRVELSTTPHDRQGKREMERGKPGHADLVYVLGMVFIDGRMAKQAPYKAEAAAEPGAWWADPRTGQIFIHFTDDSAKHSVEISTRRRCFAPHLRGLGYIQLIGFVIEHAATQYPCNFWEKSHNNWQQAGMVGTRSGHHWRIEGCTLRHTLLGIDFGYESQSNQSQGDLERSDNGRAKARCGYHEILTNRITDCMGPGTAAMEPTGIVFMGNLLERNNTMGFTGFKRWETGAVKMHHPSGSRIIGNLIRNNPLVSGIWLDGGSGPDTVVAGNLVYGNKLGFDLEIGNAPADSLLLAYNLFLNNTVAGISSRESGGIFALGNLIAGNPTAYHQSSDIKRPGKWSSQYHHLAGNLILAQSNAVVVVPPDFKNRPDLFAGRHFSANIYGAGAEDPAFTLATKQTFNFAGWQAQVQAWNPDGGAEDGSRLISGFKAELDEKTLTLTLDIPSDLPQAALHDRRYGKDYLGRDWPEGAVHAGPFMDLTPGKHTFKLWNGIRSLGPYELP